MAGRMQAIQQEGLPAGSALKESLERRRGRKEDERVSFHGELWLWVGEREAGPLSPKPGDLGPAEQLTCFSNPRLWMQSGRKQLHTSGRCLPSSISPCTGQTVFDV